MQEIPNIDVSMLYPMNKEKLCFKHNKNEEIIDTSKVYRLFQKTYKNRLADKIKKLLIHKNFNI